MSKIVIMGAGPAGLACGYYLAKDGFEVEIYAKEKSVGGISKTVRFKGFRFDVDGHRFFTKIDEVNKLWYEILGDEFLTRPRLSRIYYNKKFFDYPLKVGNVIRNLGMYEIFLCGLNYLADRNLVHPYGLYDRIRMEKIYLLQREL